MSEFEDLFADKSTNSLKGPNRYLRNKQERAKYDNLKKLEKQKLALETLQSEDFINTLRRFYTSRGDEGDFANYSTQEMIEKFYDDRIWRENNTVFMAKDLYDIKSADDIEKGDFAVISQLYNDLPMMGKGTIGFKKWAMDFIPAMVFDPSNLVGFGIGGQAAKQGSKQVVKEAIKQGNKTVTKEAIKKAAFKKGAYYGTAAGAAEAGVVAAGMDITRQATEIEAGMTDQYNLTRTLLNAGVGAGFGGVFGAVTGSWSGSSKAGKLIKEDNIEIDVGQQLGQAAHNGQTGWAINSAGEVIEIKPTKKNVKTKDGVPNNSEELSKKIDKNKGERKQFINTNKLDSGNPKATPAVKKIMDVLDEKKVEGKVRTEERVGLLNQIEKEANIKIKNKESFSKDIDAAEKVAPELASTWTGIRTQILHDADNIVKNEQILDSAVTPEEKAVVLTNIRKGIEEVGELIEKEDIIKRGISDGLQSGKIDVKLDNASRLKQEYFQTDSFKKDLKDVLDTVDGLPQDKKQEALLNIAKNLSDENRLNKIINAHKNKKNPTTWADALNEFTTANLLGDLTTHQVNILSAAIKFQKDIIDDFFSGIIMLPKNSKRGFGQMQMALDLFTQQFRFWGMSFRKAKLSWKANRSIGDALEHKFDGVRERSMETWLRQLGEEGLIKKGVAKALTPIAKISFLTLKGLQFGDTLMKNVMQRAGRVSSVNQRMRTFYPELWKNRKRLNKAGIAKDSDALKQAKMEYRFYREELANGKKVQKKLDKLDKQISKLEKKLSGKKQTSFEEQWLKLYNQYEDEFGDFRSTKSFTDGEAETLDDLTKSLINDPMYKAQAGTFTQNLKADFVEGDTGGAFQSLLKWSHKHPFLRTLLGVHFIKTPANLIRYAWHSTPVFNRLSKQYRLMLNSPDPVVRAKARTMEATGLALYGTAAMFAMSGKLTDGQEKNPAHRYAYKHVKADGTVKYYQFGRLWPLSIPFQVMADIAGGYRKFKHTFNDPLKAQSQKKLSDAAMFMAGHAFASFTNLMTSQLMIKDAFEWMGALVDTQASDAEAADEYIESMWKSLNRKATKIIPIATTWRWTNKALAEQEAETRTIMDIWASSTPHELADRIGIPYADLYPKRDAFGNEMPAPEGAWFGGLQDPIKVTEAIANHEAFSVLSSEEKLRLIDITSRMNYKKPRAKLDIGLTDKLDMNTTMVTKLDGKTVENTTFYEAMMIKKSTMKLGGLTLNERIVQEIQNPNSNLNKFTADTVLGGDYQDSVFIRGIIKDYELAAKDYLIGKATVNYNGVNIKVTEMIKKAGAIEGAAILSNKNKPTNQSGEFTELFQ